MAEFGVYRARNSEEMLDIAHTATRKIYPAANSLGVITVSGGAGVLISDVAEGLGLAMPEMPPDAQTEAARAGAVLRAAQPGRCHGPGVQRRDAGEDVHRIDGARWRICLGAGILQHDRIVAPLAGDPRAVERGTGGKSRTGSMCFRSSCRRNDATNWKPMAGWCTRTRRARWSRSMRWVVTVPRSPRSRPHRRLSLPAVTLPAVTPSEAEAKRLLAAAGIASAPEAACATADEAVAAAQRFRFPGRDEDPVAGHPAQIGNRRRPAGHRRCRCRPLRLRAAAAIAPGPRPHPRGSRAYWSQSN